MVVSLQLVLYTALCTVNLFIEEPYTVELFTEELYIVDLQTVDLHPVELGA